MLFLIFLLFGCYCALVGCVNDEGLALLSFRESVYQQGSLDNWNSSDVNPCAWKGIRCMEDKVVLISFPNHNLSGFLSPALGKLSSLRHINLRNNMFSGSLPAELFDARGLQSLYLSGNSFSGALPPEMGRLSSLQKLDLSQNSFSGPIPASIQQIKKLKVLVLSHNNFTGSLPDGLGTSLVSLTKLDFSFNRFSGSIPDDMGSLSSLQGALNLSHNLLTGPIPESLANLPLKLYIDLSYNNLTGKIPQKGALQSVGPTAFLENPLLCGPPSKTACSGDLDSQSFLHNPSNNTKHNKGKAGLATAVAVATVGICLVGILFSYWYRKAYASSSSNEGKLAYGCNFEDALMIRKELFCFTKSDMETLSENREQCDFVPLDSQVNFSLDQLLKASAFLLRKSGIEIVYKVVLEEGRTVAVIRIGDGSSQRFKEFQTEVEAIGKIRHPNIVTLRAYCWSLHEKLLIYDYIPNGDLATAIHGKAGIVSSKPPSWPVRLRIMKGIARGLAYLHDHSTKKYVHGDLKPSNILLGNDMKPHISDFGLSRLAEPQLVQTPQQSSPYMLPATSSADTYYQAPEASRLAKPSQKWDVYSYGVILLEMISRKSPLLQMRSPGCDLVGWIQLGIEKGKPLRDLLDPCLAYDLNKQEIIVALQLGLACVHVCPERRPSMKHVLNQLDKLGTCTD